MINVNNINIPELYEFKTMDWNARQEYGKYLFTKLQELNKDKKARELDHQVKLFDMFIVEIYCDNYFNSYQWDISINTKTLRTHYSYDGEWLSANYTTKGKRLEYIWGNDDVIYDHILNKKGKNKRIHIYNKKNELVEILKRRDIR